VSRPLLTALLLATGACATYHARPLDPAGTTARYNARSLGAASLLAALDSLGVPPPNRGWSDWSLGQAAWVLRPERARLAAEVRVAEAARITAGAREVPGINTETEYSFSGTTGESRWGLALSGVFTVELGGKRGARIGRANAGVLAAVARREEEAWGVRWRVREASVQLAAGEALLAAAERERELTDSVAVLVRRRFDDGTLAATEVARADAVEQNAVAEVAALRRDVSERRTALAVAVGVPLAELQRIVRLPDSALECPGGLSRDSLQNAALDARPVLRRALAEYQVAEAEVRVEVAKSWPDLQLGPGLFFDHGVGKWTIGFGAPSLPLHGNRGPIGEAEARREVAAARVAEVQQQILDDLEQALAGCAAARVEAQSLEITAVRRRMEIIDAAYARGEAGKLEVGLARLELLAAERRFAAVSVRLALARLDLERATGQWGPSTATGMERERQ
jgi:outer membrane protein, heavy metal efflux system